MTGSTPTEYLDVAGGRLAYEVAGTGSPIVLLHEGIVDRRMWDREFPRLARSHHVVRYDLRGYGGSSPATAPFYSTADLLAVLDRLQADRPVLVGPSMGGKIALDLALERPDRVGGLLLVAPGYSGMDYDHVPGGKVTFERDERLSTAAVEAWKAGDLERAIGHLRELWASALTGSSRALFERMARENAAEVLGDRSGQFERREGPLAATRLPEVRVPTELLVGDRDNPAMPHTTKFLADRIPDAHLTVVAGADHLLNLSAPAAFDEGLDRLLARVRSS